jgi:hypothetical protein
MFGWLRGLFGTSDRPEDRRKYARYELTAPLEVTIGDRRHKCRIENVSAGGIRLSPPFPVEPGELLNVRDPQSELSLDGSVVGLDPGGVRVRFKSEEAGIIVSAWLRVSNETRDDPSATAG